MLTINSIDIFDYFGKFDIQDVTCKLVAKNSQHISQNYNYLKKQLFDCLPAFNYKSVARVMK